MPSLLQHGSCRGRIGIRRDARTHAAVPLVARTRSVAVRASSEPPGPKALTATDWQQRAKQRARKEVLEAAPRLGMQASALSQKLDDLEALLPNMPINLELLKASDWARIASDPELAAKVVMIKVSFPGLNVEQLLTRHPKVLLWSAKQLQANLADVCRVLHQLPRPEVVLAVLPEVLDPKQLLSVVASVRKWYPKRDPLEVLQADPEVVRRAEMCDVPLEPVFFDTATGSWTAAGYSRQQQQEWQVYIEQVIYKRKPQPIDSATSVVLAPGAGAGAGAGAVGADGTGTGNAGVGGAGGASAWRRPSLLPLDANGGPSMGP